ncbi:MAG: thiol-disulfide isomerase/thioredoxin [Polaribacter sp.]|jgi:thiol-disulfide isomerase/thioredoxin
MLKKHLPGTLFLISLIAIFSGCLVMENNFSKVAPGIWRATLQLDDKEKISNPKGKPLPELMEYKFEEVSGGELPFNFEVKYVTDSIFFVEIHNGEERIEVRDIETWKLKSSSNDSIRISFPLYDSYIEAAFEERVMSGVWVVTNRGTYYSIPFTARFGQGHRFTDLKKEPITSVSGKWAVNFGIDGDDPWPAIGHFEQNGNDLTGTFTTETGDYRYLEGTIQKNKMYLSCFDGAHAFLFEAKYNEDSTLIGSFRSGKHYKTLWEGKRNAAATLTDPNQLTFLKEGYDEISFSFKTPDGKTISTEDESLKGKAKIYQLFGTWCPNCKDETAFLTDYLQKNKPDDLVVIGLAFEKHKDQSKAHAAIKKYKERFKMPYDIVLAGPANKEKAAEALPMLNHILSYPTLIFVDKNDKVRKIHTGFYGPATEEYQAFKTDFAEIIKSLLK